MLEGRSLAGSGRWGQRWRTQEGLRCQSPQPQAPSTPGTLHIRRPAHRLSGWEDPLKAVPVRPRRPRKSESLLSIPQRAHGRGRGSPTHCTTAACFRLSPASLAQCPRCWRKGGHFKFILSLSSLRWSDLGIGPHP